MSDAPKKRPWFQYHLSTAIVLQFVAGGLMWANMRVRRTGTAYWDEIWQQPYRDPPDRNVTLFGKGWPVAVQQWHQNSVVTMPQPELSHAALLVNALFGLVAIVLVACVCEWFIRRRERRHE